MRKIFIAAMTLVSCVSVTSCFNMERSPYDKVSSSTFWKTEDQVNQGIMGIYADMKNGNNFGLQFEHDGMSDIAFGAFETIVYGTYTNTNGTVSAKWQSGYDGIGRANTAIQNIPTSTISEENKALYIAEARFMRALYYADLINFFGGVPIYDETTILAEDFANMLKPRSTVEEVRTFIYADLAEAESKLPVKWSESNYGRATKGAAIALRGKVKLYAKDYAGAKADFLEVIKPTYGYTLNDSYAKMFTPEQDQCAEIIFAVQNQGGTGQNYGMAMCFYFGSRSTFGSCWSSVTPSVKLADMYEEADGRPFNWDEYVPGFNADNKIKDATFRATLAAGNKTVATYPKDIEKLKAAYANRDPRMNETLIVPYSNYTGWVANKEKPMTYVVAKGVNESNGFIRLDQGKDSYLFRKFVPEGDWNGQILDRSHTPVNFPLIRLADVLLMLAECENEVGTQEAAVGYINQVRARKSTNMPAINSGPAYLAATTKAQVFERIAHERAVELAGEGHRFNDIRRWGKGIEWLNFDATEFTGKYYHKHVFTDRDYLWPIPKTEIEKNATLEQNPGWL